MQRLQTVRVPASLFYVRCLSHLYYIWDFQMTNNLGPQTSLLIVVAWTGRVQLTMKNEAPKQNKKHHLQSRSLVETIMIDRSIRDFMADRD